MSESPASIFPDGSGRDLSPGALVQRYVILEPLGRGGMGAVYAAFDTQLARRVAIKVLRQSSSKSEEARARLLREAQAMARLSHPNVVAIFDAGTFDGKVFLAMELIDGVTLREWLEQPRPYREVLEVLKAAGRGLSAAHAAGLVHRDFKPDNVLIGKDGRVSVTDFGLARSASPSAPGVRFSREGVPRDQVAAALSAGRRPSDSPTSGSLAMAVSGTESEPLDVEITQDGALLGTIGFMSPEQAFEPEMDARTDQFSFCVTAYLALYGQYPFGHRGLNEFLSAIQSPPRPPPEGSPVPTWIRDILFRGLSTKARDRFPSMADLLAALDADPTRLQRRRLAAAASAAVVACALALSFVVHARGVRDVEARCRAGEALVRATWSDDVRRRVAEAIGGSAAAAALDTSRRAVAALDEYAASWAAAHREASEATLLRHGPSEGVLEERLACLERQRAALAALVDEVAHEGGQGEATALDAIYTLDAPKRCLDRSVLRDAVGLPADERARERVISARRAIAKVRALGMSDRYKEAIALGEGALADVRAIPHRATEAELLALISELRENHGDYVAAVDASTGSLAAAEAAGHGALAMRAAARIAFMTSDKLRRVTEARQWLSLARGKYERLGQDDALEYELLDTEMAVEATDGHPERTLPLYGRLLEVTERVYGPKHMRMGFILTNEADDLERTGQGAAALTTRLKAVKIFEEAYGREHATLGIQYFNLGMTLSYLQKYADADAVLRRALAIREKRGEDNQWNAWIYGGMASVALRTGDFEVAEERARRAVSIAESHGEDGVASLPTVYEALGEALTARGKYDAALPYCARAAKLLEAVAPFTAERLYGPDVLSCMGEAELGLGRAKEAVAHFERSVALPRRREADGLARAHFGLARAMRAAGADAMQARAHASHARALMEALPTKPRELAEVEAWLAAGGAVATRR